MTEKSSECIALALKQFAGTIREGGNVLLGKMVKKRRKERPPEPAPAESMPPVQ